MNKNGLKGFIPAITYGWQLGLDELYSGGATSGQVLGWNGTTWIPVNAGGSSSGPVLIGKILGYNLNLESSAVVTYTGLTGYPFTIGDRASDQNNGHGGIITAVSSGSLTVGNPNGNFNDGDTVIGTYALITYTGETGLFTVGEDVTDGTGDSGTVVSDDGAGNLVLSITSGGFVAGATITGTTSGHTATVVTYTAPATATISSYTPSFSNQAIMTLISAGPFVPTDLVLTNASTSLSQAQDLEIWTGSERTGFQVSNDNGHLSALVNPTDFISATAISENTSTPVTNELVSQSSLYVTYATPQGSAATVDVYLYGYKIG